jgi:hypothetical protein
MNYETLKQIIDTFYDTFDDKTEQIDSVLFLHQLVTLYLKSNHVDDDHDNIYDALLEQLGI